MATMPTTVAARDLDAHWLRASALGGIAWTAAVALLWPGHDPGGLGLASIQLLLSPLALLPLAFALIRLDSTWRLVRLAAWAQLPAAALLAAAYVSPAGPVAMILTLPWLAFTGLVALIGLARLRELASPAGWAVSAGLVYVAVGGAWTCASRLGRGFLGFEEPIVLLTGAHFHYAGLLLPILTGLAARRLRHGLANVACLAVIVAVPLVAVGITLAAHGLHLPDLFAAVSMAATGFLVAVLQLLLAQRAHSPVPRVLFAVSGISLVIGMALAGAYAIGNFAQVALLTIPQMIRSHAAINVFGFVVPGLLAWLTESHCESKSRS